MSDYNLWYFPTSMFHPLYSPLKPIILRIIFDSFFLSNPASSVPGTAFGCLQNISKLWSWLMTSSGTTWFNHSLRLCLVHFSLLSAEESQNDPIKHKLCHLFSAQNSTVSIHFTQSQIQSPSITHKALRDLAYWLCPTAFSCSIHSGHTGFFPAP